ncbi:MAG: CoA transferase [Chloroflexi bacterium]|nr:CoA transferase [Chloroflexota bacterium]
MTSPCDGLRVVDFSMGMPGGMATMILSDFGAEVIKVEPPMGDPFRAWPAALLWNRGKKSVTLDLKTPEGRDQAQLLSERADVVVESFRPGKAAALGIGWEELSQRNPGLVYCSITGFGQTGPYKNYKGYEGVVAARTGRMLVFEGQKPRPGPVYAAVQTASHSTSQAAVQNILAALLVRAKTGRGQWVQTSLVQGMMSYDIRDLVIRQLSRRDPVTFPLDLLGSRGRLPTLTYLPAQTKDGRWIQMANGMERLFHAWVQALDLWNLYDDPRFMEAPQLTEENREQMRDILLARMREKTLDEWMDIFIKNGNVSAEPVVSTQDGMEHPQVLHNRHVEEVDDPTVGRMRQLGVLADLQETPGRIQGPAPTVGQHTQQVLADLHHRAPVGPSAPAGNGRLPRHPLEGITVLEFASIIAGPYSASLMADMGARVIKVEPPEGDHIRAMMGMRGTGAVKLTQGKESICIDLKLPEGQSIVHKLIAKSDVLLHNYRPGVPERLGMDYETAKGINPTIVYVYFGGYGSTGPHSLRPAFHPVPGAAIGGALLQAGAGMPPPPEQELSWEELKEVSRQLFRANETNPDPNSGVVIASTMMLGLYARQTAGKGQWGQVNMLGSNAYANADDFFWYQDKPPRPEPDTDGYGLCATYRLYPAKEGWVFLACLFEEEWQSFCAAVERLDLLQDPRFATAEARAANDAVLSQVLSEVFKGCTADQWEALLTAADVACVRADGNTLGEFYEESQHCQQNGFVRETDHLRFGTYWRHSGLAHFSLTPGRYGPGVIAGQHTRQLLRELGYTQEEIDDLKQRGVVNWEEP